jgi:hypothetical protein
VLATGPMVLATGPMVLATGPMVLATGPMVLATGPMTHSPAATSSRLPSYATNQWSSLRRQI